MFLSYNSEKSLYKVTFCYTHVIIRPCYSGRSA